MSDDNAPAVEEVKKKRGRQAKVDKSPVKDAKKRGRAAAEKPAANHKSKSDGEEDGPPGPVKRGRGRPKGTHKAASKKAKKTTKSAAGGRGRGRPKKTEDKPESTGDDEDQEEDN